MTKFKFYVHFIDKHGVEDVSDVWSTGTDGSVIIEDFYSEYGDDVMEITRIVPTGAISQV
jgi:hypothetical protein